MVLVSILSIVAESVINGFADHISGDLYDKLRGDPVKKAYQAALTEAVSDYIQEGEFALKNSLLRTDGVLTYPDVIAELQHILSFNRKPDAALIGQRWRESLNNIPPRINFTREAEILLSNLEYRLSETDVFQPAFELKQLEKLDADAKISARTLSEIDLRLANLTSIIDGKLGSLLQIYKHSTPGIHAQIRDFTAYIEDKTREFVGRQFIFDAIDKFIFANPRGYFLIKGDPGIGKTAISAQLVKSQAHIHHFNVRGDGINKASDFLANVCAQLIARYTLNIEALPDEAVRDASFLNTLLVSVSRQLNSDKCIIVIDALDEADISSITGGANILYLPLTLPNNIYIIATMRREQINLRIDCEYQVMSIEQDSADNVGDIRKFINHQTSSPGIQSYISRNGIDEELFVDHLVEKSQGNFIYLRLVLPEIERGVYTDLSLTSLPIGLESYYEEHWKLIQRQSTLDWFDYKLPIVIALTVIKEAVSIKLLSEYSEIERESPTKPRIRAVLHSFDQFIYRIEVTNQGSKQVRYRWYHHSFFDFVARKDEVEEGVSFIKAKKKIAAHMWKSLYGDDSTDSKNENNQ